MKKIVLFVCLALSCVSCYNTLGKYYQVCKTNPSSPDVDFHNNTLQYEDKRCSIQYDFWQNGGSSSFRFTNKTNHNIYVHLDECFLVVNGDAVCYFKNRTFTYSQSQSSSATNEKSVKFGASNSRVSGAGMSKSLQSFLGMSEESESSSVSSGSSNGVQIPESMVICVPHNSSRVINGDEISLNRYRACGMRQFPDEEQIKTISFSNSNSPYQISFRVSYSVGSDNDLYRVNNDFYVSEITNYPYDNFFKHEDKVYCGDTVSYDNSVPQYFSPTSFYNFYYYSRDAYDY